MSRAELDSKTKTQKKDLSALIELTYAEMQRVNSLILARLGSQVQIIPEVSKHLIDSGGKRLRPMLTLASAQLCGYEGEGHILLATAIEFMHTATLLHDDVVDESALRRGRVTARSVWGNQASVLVGDFLLGQAFKIMVEVGSLDGLSVLANAAAIIAEGEVMQLAAARSIATKEEEYFKVIYAKTAALFAAAAEEGPILAGKTERERQALAQFGANLGLAFQLVDDALDYGGSAQNLGKNVGDDFREGKITLPVILCLAQANEKEKLFWQEALEQEKNNQQALDYALALLKKYGTLEQTIERAKSYGKKAQASLEIFADGACKQALRDVVDFCIARIS